MSDRPFMPLWTGDYLKKTRHLTTLEHGAYLLLIMECWERPSGSIPNKPELLARLAGVTIAEWVEISPMVLEFFRLNKRKKEYTQERVTEERAKVALKRVLAQQSIAKRWNKKKKDDTNVLPTKNERNTNHNHNHKDKNYTKEFELFFAEFPNKLDKHAASKNFTKEKKFTTAIHLTECAKVYARCVEESKTEFIYKAKNFIAQKYYENYQPEDNNIKMWEYKYGEFEKGQWLDEWGCRPKLNGWKIAEHGECPAELAIRFLAITGKCSEEGRTEC